MDIAYLGLASGGLALLEAGHRLVAAATTERQGPATERLSRALSASGVALGRRPVLLTPDAGAFLHDGGARLLVCYLWDRLLAPSLLESFPEGALSYHPSLLPRHRGPDPYFWTLWLGDERAGASVLRLDAGVDTGPVLAQRALMVERGWSAADLAQRLDLLGLDLLLEVLGRWESEGPLRGEDQGEAEATAAPFPDDELLEIRWSWPAERIARLVRAASPHPGAFTVAGEGPLIVLEAHVVARGEPGALEPGDAILLDEGVTIWTGRDGLVLDAVVTPEGAILRGEAVAGTLPGLADLRRAQRPGPEGAQT